MRARTARPGPGQVPASGAGGGPGRGGVGAVRAVPAVSAVGAVLAVFAVWLVTAEAAVVGDADVLAEPAVTVVI